MEPVVDVMADLLSAVSTVITSFTSWLTALTTALISNPVIQLIFAVGIIFSIINFVLCLLIDRGNKKSSSKKYISTVDNTSFDNENDYYSHVSELIFDDDDITNNSKYSGY